MAKNFKALGEVFDYPCTRTIESGSVVVMTDTVGVALARGESGDVIAVRAEGVFELPKATGTALAQGKKVYWDANGPNIVATATGNTYAGKVYVAADSAATTVQVSLNA